MSVQAIPFWVTLMNVTSDNINFKAQSVAQRFETVFADHWSRVYNVVFRLVGDRDEAQDLALETFWQYYRNPPAKQENLIGWLYRVAVNLGFNALRARKRRSHYEIEAGSQAIENQSPPEPEQEIILAEQRREVQDVLARMKSRSAMLLVLRYSGLNYKELATVLNMQPSSIGKTLARAQAEFEALFNQVEGG
jgi:RNA polymerase sigma-70 factor (ECF subfamily)